MTLDQSSSAPSVCNSQSAIRNPQSQDVIICGAGPAGTSAAILLAEQGRRVLLLEKSCFPREKLCGEFLSPETLRLFERLGVRERIMDAGAQMIRKWYLVVPNGRRIEIPLAWLSRGGGAAVGLSRARMDAVLLDRAREVGVTVREGFHVSPHLTRDENLSLIEGRADGATVERFAAPLVIDASGRNRLFARAQSASAEAKGARPFGMKVHLRGVAGMDGIGELFFFRDGYGGMSNVEGGRTNLCFITTEETLRAARGDRHALLEMTMLTNPAAEERLRGAVVDGEWLGTGPLNYGRQPGVRGALAIGDAGAFIDPFTGSGMLLAMTSGELVARVIGQAGAEADIDEIAQNYRQLQRRHFGWRFRACALLRSLAFRPLTRNMLALLLARHSSLARLVAISTRQ